MRQRARIPLRITLVGPPAGVLFGIQHGPGQVPHRSRAHGETLSLDTSIEVSDSPRPIFYGESTQGPPAGRFVYVNSGTLAGDSESCWTRRAKVPLAGITRALVDEVRAHAGALLEARIEGKSKDGGPVCASVALLDGGWRIIEP